MVHDERLVAVQIQFTPEVGHLGTDLAVTDAVAQDDAAVGILLLGLAQKRDACHLGREDKAVNGLVQLGVHVVALGLVNAVNTHHDTRVAILTDASGHHSHEGIPETVHMDDILPLAQQARKTDG